MKTIYIENDIKNHPRVETITKRFTKNANIVYCAHYAEVFNPKGQNYKIQKQSPALILASKKFKRVIKEHGTVEACNRCGWLQLDEKQF